MFNTLSTYFFNKLFFSVNYSIPKKLRQKRIEVCACVVSLAAIGTLPNTGQSQPLQGLAVFLNLFEIEYRVCIF